MTVKNYNHDELAKLRKGAHKQTKLSVSRPAKRVRSPKTYFGTGNTFAYVESVIGQRPSKELMKRVNQSMDYTGVTPDASTIRSWV